MSRAAYLAMLLLMIPGCKSSTVGAGDAGAAPRPSAAASSLAVGDAGGLGTLGLEGIAGVDALGQSLPPEPEPLALGPAAKGAPPAEHEKVVLSLLGGELESARLPLRATDDGRPVRTGLRGELAPERFVPDRPVVKIAKVVAKGSLPEMSVQRTVRQSAGRLRLCYEREKGDADLSGKVTLHLEIEPDGHVSQVTTKESTVSGRGLLTCLESALRRASFVASDDKKPTTADVSLDLGAGAKGL